MNDFNYKKLIVWQKAILLLKEIYTLMKKLPGEEEFNLKNQLRRAAVSVVSNIAEGSGRKSSNDRTRFYEISRTSCLEIDTQSEVSVLLNYLSEEECSNANGLIVEVFKMLTKMMN